ncbi:MAG: NAD(P)/FAD-dependent oxidoreductase [Burkholderiaceae bacterium]
MPTPTQQHDLDSAPVAPLRVAVVGAGMAGITCARTLMQAGHSVSVFEKSRQAGGRMATRQTNFGTFDHGAQYFTVRDERFALALQTAAQGICKPWSANTVQLLDEFGRVAAIVRPGALPHWVPVPGMNALLQHWAAPLRLPPAPVPLHSLELNTRVVRIERDALKAHSWQLRTQGVDDSQQVFGGFDAVLLALPHVQAQELLASSAVSPALAAQIAPVKVAPCWTLMLAFPQALQANLYHLGPQWNAARSTHHRIAWVARESSKPGRDPVERWTVQASAAWSQEHLEDDNQRVQAKLLKAFAEVTGIRAEPSHAALHRWRYAQTLQALGQSHLWDSSNRIGACGDWCLGRRVEDAFVSGLELALVVAACP